MGSKQWTVIVLIVVLVSGGVWFTLAYNAKNKPAASPTMAPMHMASTQPSASAGGSTAESTNAVTISNYAFSPANITVAKGTTVTWTNKDSVGHTVTETDNLKGPASSVLNNGDTYSFTFDTAGTYHYHCSIHHEMVGTVTVTD